LSLTVIIAAAVLSGFFWISLFYPSTAAPAAQKAAANPSQGSSHSGPCLSGGGKKATVPAAFEPGAQGTCGNRAECDRLPRRSLFASWLIQTRASFEVARKVNISTGLA